MGPSILEGLSDSVRAQTDYRGQLTPKEARTFAAALDIGLMPLEDNPFNQSRFPIKFADYLGVGTPVLASAVGDCAALYGDLPGVMNAGRGRQQWNSAFGQAVQLASKGLLPVVDLVEASRRLGWDRIGEQLEALYMTAFAS
jgi:hypothetical protein